MLNLAAAHSAPLDPFGFVCPGPFGLCACSFVGTRWRSRSDLFVTLCFVVCVVPVYACMCFDTGTASACVCVAVCVAGSCNNRYGHLHCYGKSC